MKRIIVEGVDGSGKTTLVRMLTDSYPGLYLIRNDMEDKQDFPTWWTAVLSSSPPAMPIHDRFFYSELVYGPVIRGKINAPPHLIQAMGIALASEAFLIYCRPPFDVISKNVERSEHQMEGVVENLDELVNKYDQTMDRVAKSGYFDRFFMHNYTDPNSTNIVLSKVGEYITSVGQTL